MINRIVIGMTAKKFRELNNIPKGESIRPYLTEEQLNSLEKLQIIDVGLMVVEPDLKKRKLILESYLINMERAA